MKKKLAIFALMIIFGISSNFAFAAKTKPTATKKASEYTYVTNKIYKGGQYTGQWSKSKPNGKGILIFDDVIEQGSFKNGELDGKGSMTTIYNGDEKIVLKSTFKAGAITDKINAIYYSNGEKLMSFEGELDVNGSVKSGVFSDASSHQLYSVSRTLPTHSFHHQEPGIVVKALDEGLKLNAFKQAIFFENGITGIEYSAEGSTDLQTLLSYEGEVATEYGELNDFHPNWFKLSDYLMPKGKGMLYWLDGAVFESDSFEWGVDMPGIYTDADGNTYNFSTFNMESGFMVIGEDPEEETTTSQEEWKEVPESDAILSEIPIEGALTGSDQSLLGFDEFDALDSMDINHN